MTDDLRELRARLRRLAELRDAHGTADHESAQAVSAAQRASRHGDRTRDPPPALRALLERAEVLGRLVTSA